MSEQNIISKYVPNFITLLSLSCGFTSIRFSLNGELEIAIYLILIATIFDFFDGWFARKLKSGSSFGAELDLVLHQVFLFICGLLILLVLLVGEQHYFL